MLTLLSSDNQEEFEVKEPAAMQSTVFKYMIEEGFADNSIPLPDIPSHILTKVIEYCNRHAELKISVAGFVKVEPATFFDLNKAANYLGIKGLLDLTGQTIADMIKGKTPKEIRKTFNINDLTISSTPALAAAMRSSERKQMEARFDAFRVHWEETAEERMTEIARGGKEPESMVFTR